MTSWQPTNSPTFSTGKTPHDPTRLRPMTLADILDTTFVLIKRNWQAIAIVVIAISAPVAVVTATVNLALGLGTGTTSIWPGIGGASTSSTAPDSTGELAGLGVGVVGLLAVVLVSLFVTPLVTGIIARIVASSYLGRQLTAGEAFRAVVRLWLPLLGASFLDNLLRLLCVLPFLAVGIGLVVAIGGVAGVLVSIPVFLACVIPVIALWVLFVAANPAIAVEEVGAVGGLKRSWNLMKGRFWHYLGTLLLFSLITQFIAAAVAGVPAFISVGFSAAGLAAISWFFDALSTILSNIVTLPIGAVVATLLYFDARVRQEGFDVQMMAAQLPGAAGNTGAEDRQLPPSEQRPSDQQPYGG